MQPTASLTPDEALAAWHEARGRCQQHSATIAALQQAGVHCPAPAFLPTSQRLWQEEQAAFATVCEAQRAGLTRLNQ